MLQDFEVAIDRLFAFVLGRPLSADTKRMIIELSSFKYLSGGREPGQADARSFYRKGVAGDHRGRFAPALLERAARKVGGMAAQLKYIL